MAGSVNDEFIEDGRVIVKEEAVLEKFNGEVADGDIAERIYLLDGVITHHEYYENGQVVKTEQYEDGSLVEERSE